MRRRNVDGIYYGYHHPKCRASVGTFWTFDCLCVGGYEYILSNSNECNFLYLVTVADDSGNHYVGGCGNLEYDFLRSSYSNRCCQRMWRI
jgi:hypothetical protein